MVTTPSIILQGRGVGGQIADRRAQNQALRQRDRGLDLSERQVEASEARQQQASDNLTALGSAVERFSANPRDASALNEIRLRSPALGKSLREDQREALKRTNAGNLSLFTAAGPIGDQPTPDQAQFFASAAEQLGLPPESVSDPANFNRIRAAVTAGLLADDSVDPKVRNALSSGLPLGSAEFQRAVLGRDAGQGQATLSPGQVRVDAEGTVIARGERDPAARDIENIKLQTAQANLEAVKQRTAIAAAERGEEVRDTTTAAEVSFGELGNALATLDTLDADVLARIFGPLDNLTPTVSAETGAAEAGINQILGLLSLEARQKLRGTGTITDNEQATLERSVSTLGNRSIRLDSRAIETELGRIRGVLTAGQGRARDQLLSQLKAERAKRAGTQ